MQNGHAHHGHTHSFERLSYDTIGACIEVQRQLGRHCMEVDYQRALELALAKRGVTWEREVHIPIVFEGVTVTKRRVDFVVEREGERLIMETKARSVILPEDVEQCMLYLRQGGYHTCLLVNFGERPLGIRRLVNTTPPAATIP
jgi:GxxExxY protein